MGGGAGFDLATNTYIVNDNYYLNGNSSYWAMTPFVYTGDGAGVDDVDNGGFVNIGDVGNNRRAVRPVVSLKSDAISGGVGTVNNPFYVNEKP